MFFLITSCATKSQDLIVLINNQKLIVASTQDLDHQTYPIGKNEITFSSFNHLNQAEKEKLAHQRKTHFLKIFNDDKDPYTLNVVKRSQYLISQTEDEVVFFDKKDLFTPLKRKWILCSTSIFEATYAAKIHPISFECR